MALSGYIGVTFDFNDTASSPGLETIKKVRLSKDSAFTAGQVAVLSGTADNSQLNIDLQDLTYRNAAGDLVSFSTVYRIAFQCDPGATLRFTGNSERLNSNNNNIALTCCIPGDDRLKISTTAGTSSYILAIYGE
jgi:hypothetical protein